MKDKKDGYILSTKNSKGWYFTVILKKDGKMFTKRIHVLVAESFIGKVPKGFHVHHKDGNKQNNCVENLEIIHPCKHWQETLKQNNNVIQGLNNYNRYSKPRKIQQFSLDGHYLAEYVNSEIAGRMTGVCQRNILQVANKTPYGKNGNIRKQAGGYIWKFADEEVI